MDFNYHPILGLQVTFGLSLCELDLDVLTYEKYDWQEAFKLLQQKGIEFFNSKSNAITKNMSQITTNSIL